MSTLAGKASIVGIGATDFSKASGRSELRLAAEAGYGRELDVQLTADHRLIVHHDGNTKRVCGVDAQISRTAYADLPLLPERIVAALM